MKDLADLIKLEELIKRSKGLELTELNLETFDEFIESGIRLFGTPRTKIRFYRRIGYNKMSKSLFSNGKRPPWEYGEDILLTFDIDVDDEDLCKGLRIWFLNSLPQDLVSREGYRLKFCFDSYKRVYVREDEGNGTLEFPYERYFVKLD